jgi:hypothetical protein
VKEIDRLAPARAAAVVIPTHCATRIGSLMSFIGEKPPKEEVEGEDFDMKGILTVFRGDDDDDRGVQSERNYVGADGRVMRIICMYAQHGVMYERWVVSVLSFRFHSIDC